MQKISRMPDLRDLMNFEFNQEVSFKKKLFVISKAYQITKYLDFLFFRTVF